MFRDSNTYFGVAGLCAIAVGLLFSVSYNLSIQIQEVANHGLENAVAWSLPIPFAVQATALAFVLGSMLAFGLFCLLSPFPLAGDHPSRASRRRRAEWALVVVTTGFATIWIVIDAFWGG